AAPPPDLPPEPARPSLPPLRVPGRPDPAPAEDLAAEDPIQLETSPGTWRGETGAYGSEIELDPGGAAEPGEPGEPAEERTQTIGGEIDLEPPGGDAPALAGADDLDPLDLDESDLESLAALADDEPPAAPLPGESEALGSTRPRGAAAAREDDLFGAPDSEIGIDRDDGFEGSGDAG